MSKRILVLGSSFGGYHSAISLRKLLGKEHHIKVVSAEDIFTFVPSLPWVAMGWRNPSAIKFHVVDSLRSKGIEFVQDTVVKADPDNCSVTGEKDEYEYDYLVAATGSELDFAAIPGLGPDIGNSYSIFSIKQALESKAALERVIAKGSGSLVFCNTQGASCLGPAYEMAMMTDTHLRRKQLRNKFKISLVTNEPYLGHFGVGGFGKVTRILEDEFADRDIEWKVNCKLTQVTPEEVELDGGEKLKNDFSLIVPAFYGSHAYLGIEGLSNPRGFIIADDYLANPKYQNIYSVGVSLAIPPPVQTPVPVGVPKTGQMTETMAEIAAQNIAADIKGGSKIHGKEFEVVCISDAGDTGIYLSASPLLPPRNKLVHVNGKTVHWMKVAFEKYYMASLRYNLPKTHFGW
ncbi:MAG TPA: FAD-dependent oxidoreductase [Nitrospinota bacterium]|nr:FAD-dependent oxidoreductase [Nitrospinota bacterium]|tara:strand:- start:48080 stop:49291 length:1212 start_codon:yes stop_codon:yes gene_type:complete